MKQERGFTLIELMTVTVVVAVLAAIAFPSYNRFIVKGNRGEAQSALQQIQLLQENHRRSAGEYADNTEFAGVLTGLAKADLYQYRIDASGVTGYTVVAEAVGRQAAKETSYFGSTCSVLTLEVRMTGVTRQPAACW